MKKKYWAWREVELGLLQGETMEDVNQHRIQQEEVGWSQVLEP